MYLHKKNWSRVSKLEKYSYKGYQIFTLQMFMKYTPMCFYTLWSGTNISNLAILLSIHLADHDWGPNYAILTIYADIKTIYMSSLTFVA